MISTDQKKIDSFLKKNKDYISADAFCELTENHVVTMVPKRTLLDTDHRVFLLLSGIIRGFYLDMEGNDITHIFIMEGSIYNGGFLTTEKTHACSFETLEDCRILEIDHEKLLGRIKKDMGMLLYYINMLENSVNRKNEKETYALTKSATERYLAFQKEYPGIENRVNQNLIATYLGIAPQSLSRIRRTLREE